MPTPRTSNSTKAARAAKSSKPSPGPAEPVRNGRETAGWRRAWWVPVGLIAVTLLAYHNSLGGPFVFDDVPNVRENLKLRQPWPIWEAMWGPLNTGVSGRPLVQLSFAL